MVEIRRIPWPRLAAEGAAIVISILLAFAIDAAWESAGARRHEGRILAGLRADFEAIRSEAARVRSSHERIISAARGLLDLSGPGASVKPARLDTLLAAILPGAVFFPAQGTLSALLNSDGLGSISDLELRAELSEWSRHVASVQRAELEAQRLMNGDFMPYLHARVPVRSLDVISMPELGGAGSGFAMGTEGLLSDLRFENLVNDRLYYASQAARSLREAEHAAARILVLIERNLDP